MISWNNCQILRFNETFLFYIAEKTRSRFINLVSNAYTSISLADFSKYVGLSELEAGQLAAQQPGWQYDTENRVIRPVKAEVKETEIIPSEQQLHLLTDFVAFLEKWFRWCETEWMREWMARIFLLKIYLENTNYKTKVIYKSKDGRNYLFGLILRLEFRIISLTKYLNVVTSTIQYGGTSY